MTKRILSLICTMAMLATLLVLPTTAANVEWTWKNANEKEPVTDYAYSFVAVGDTQNVCKKEPEKMNNIYDWIVNNIESKKIKYVFGMGDVTNDSSSAEWKNALEQHQKLDGKVPYSIIRGNHDISFDMNRHFANETYMSQFEGFYEEGKIDNSWRTITIGEVDYLMVTIDYAAKNAILDWASEVIAAHPHHRVIISTHCYLFRDGNTVNKDSQYAPDASGKMVGKINNGDSIWDYLIRKHENIFMVLSGHIASDDVIMTEAKGDHGNTVYQFLIDPQDLDNSIGATGMVAILYFSEDGKKVSVEQYSTVREQFYMSTSQFSFEIPEFAPHSFTNYVSDGNVTCTENGTETAKCDVCEKTHVRELAATGHSYTEGVCSVCGAADPNYVPPQEETPTEDPEQTPETPDGDDGKSALPVILIAVAGVVIVGGAAAAIVITSKKRKG